MKNDDFIFIFPLDFLIIFLVFQTCFRVSGMVGKNRYEHVAN